MSQKSNFLEDAVINHFLRNTAAASPATVYVALSTADPTEDGSGLAEPTGGYARQAATFDAPSPAGETQNSGTLTFGPATSDWGSITHFAVFDALTLGNMLYYGALTAAKTINTDDSGEFAAGDLQIDEL